MFFDFNLWVGLQKELLHSDVSAEDLIPEFGEMS
jgi:hypothetical protein